MATESLKSTKPGDAKFKPKAVSASAGDKKQTLMNGGKRSKGISNDLLLKLGRGLARAAADGKGY